MLQCVCIISEENTAVEAQIRILKMYKGISHCFWATVSRLSLNGNPRI